jgi:hypothetical protein
MQMLQHKIQLADDLVDSGSSMNKYHRRMQQLTDFGASSMEPQKVHPVSESALNAFEQELGHALPADYREFLRCFGEFFVGTGCRIPDADPNGPQFLSIESFYGVDARHPEKDLLKNYFYLKKDLASVDITEPDLLPLGTSVEGIVAIALSGDFPGAIYFWSGDTDRIHAVTGSFDEFMCLLEPRPDH